MSILSSEAWYWRPPSPYDYTLYKEILAFIRRSLPPEQRKLAVMLVDGDSDEEIAMLMQLDRGTVQALTHKMRLSLQVHLDGETTANWQDLLKHKNRMARK